MEHVSAGLTVGEAAAKVGMSVHTLRWYEQEGLIAPVGRDATGRRRYDEDELDWLVLLTRLRGTGMPVREMRRYAELARIGPETVGARRRLFEEHRLRVLERIAALHRDLEAIEYKIKIYDEMEHECESATAVDRSCVGAPSGAAMDPGSGESWVPDTGTAVAVR